jgi:hypothetical protein
MPVLSAAQLAIIRRVKLDNYPDLLSVYAPAAIAGGKGAGQTAAATSQPCRRWPAAKAQKLIAAIPELAGIRLDELIFFPDNAAGLARGGELRSASGEKLKIEGLARWQTTYAVAASLVKP